MTNSTIHCLLPEGVRNAAIVVDNAHGHASSHQCNISSSLSKTAACDDNDHLPALVKVRSSSIIRKTRNYDSRWQRNKLSSSALAKTGKMVATNQSICCNDGLEREVLDLTQCTRTLSLLDNRLLAPKNPINPNKNDFLHHQATSKNVVTLGPDSFEDFFQRKGILRSRTNRNKRSSRKKDSSPKKPERRISTTL